MRILIVTTQDRFFLSHIIDRANYFKAQGCTVGVAAQKTSDDKCNKIKALGFDFFDTKIERKSLNPLTQLLAVLRLYRIQSKYHPDISYHLGAKSIFYGTFTARLNDSSTCIVNAPIGLGYIFASNSIKAKILRPFVLLLYKYFLNPPKSKVIIENNDDIQFFIKKGFLSPRNSYCILGAGVDTAYFSPLPFSKRNNICTVVMASRLIKEKGVLDFVQSANILYQNNIPVRMILIGDPDYGNPSSITEKEFLALKNNPALECVGFKSDVAPYLKNAHICCLPSFYREGLPKILVEATSCGLAIITTETIGCKEAVRENNGILIPPHAIDKIADSIKFLLEHPKVLEEMGNNSRKVALHYFDRKLICKRTFEILKNLYDEKNNHREKKINNTGCNS